MVKHKLQNTSYLQVENLKALVEIQKCELKSRSYMFNSYSMLC